MSDTTTIDRIALIKELGVEPFPETEWVGEVGPDRHQVDLPNTVRGLVLPLTPVEWISIATRDGASYMGGCCGNMGALQDVIAYVFRDSGWVDGHTFLRIGEMARGHEGFDEFQPMDDDAFLKAVEQWKKTRDYLDSDEGKESGLTFDPWYKLGVVYNAVEPMLVPNSADNPHGPGREGRTRDMVSTLAHTLADMSWRDMFTRNDPDELAVHEANRELLRARAYPMMVTLAAAMEEEGIGFEGYAIVRIDTDDVLSTSQGLCLYPDLEAAERAMELWQRWADEAGERAERRTAEQIEQDEEDNFWLARVEESEIVSARVTVESGLELRV